MIKGYNFYLDGVKVNESLHLSSHYTFTGLRSNTEYSIRATAVDMAGNESVLSDELLASTMEFTPIDGPMPLELRNGVDAIINDVMADGAGPGMSISISGPKGYYAKAFGSAGPRDLTVDDHFRMGSLTKTFTATAVLRAIDQGLLSFEDTLNQFDTATHKVSAIDKSEKITIRHLLMMRSGVFDYQAAPAVILVFFMAPTWPWSPANALQHMVSNPSQFEPGTQFQYTNSNYVLLGLILEAVTGRTIRQIIHEDIITPLGLTETLWPETNALPEPFANGYGGPQGPNQDATGFNPQLFDAAGALVSTITDLQKWGQAMRDGTLLSPEMHNLWETTFCPIPLGSEYGPPEVGYGLGIYEFGSWYGHPGSVPGYECSTMYEKNSGAVISIFENSQTPTEGIPLTVFSRVFPELAEYLYPGTIDAKTYTECVLPTDPFVGQPNPADIGYDGVSAPFSGLKVAEGEFQASSGADIFAIVSWDRPGAPDSVTYGDTPMSLVATVSHDNNANQSYGGAGIYRLAGGGTGNPATLRVSGANGWLSLYGISFKGVQNVGAPEYAWGNSKDHEQEVTVSNDVVLQVFSAGNGGGSVYDLSNIIGAKNRARQVGTNPLLCVSTTAHSGLVRSVSTNPNRWGSMAIDLEIA